MFMQLRKEHNECTLEFFRSSYPGAGLKNVRDSVILILSGGGMMLSIEVLNKR